jgi:hypothetical protein
MLRDHFNLPANTPIEPLTALYFATVTQASLGFGDITPKTQQARLLTTIHCLLGWMPFMLVWA